MSGERRPTLPTENPSIYATLTPMFTLPAPLRHALFALFIGGILAYGAALAGYLLVNFDLVNLLRDVNGDDSFYYFQIAYHLSEGKFSTFDGGISRTNGYHPIWLLLITPFYWIFDKETALFAIKALEIMLIAGAVALIAVAARLARLPWYLLFALLPILYQQRNLFAGLEAAAALFMLGLLFLALLLYARNPERWTWPLAVVAFALPWVRLEYIAISLTATTALLLMEWLRRERPADVSWRAALISTPARTFAPTISAIAGILTYFAYNKLVFGGIVPVSGASKRWWSQTRWENADGYRLTRNFQEIRQIDVFNNETLLTALAICAGFLLLLLVWWLGRRSRSREEWLLLAFLVGGFSLAVGHIAKFAQTVLQVDRYAGDYGWYFVPAYLMLALVVPLAGYVAIHFLRRFIGPRSALAANGVSGVILVVGAVWLFAGADFTGPFRWVEWKSQSTERNWDVTSYMGTPVVNAALPEDSVIGSYDAGVIGYFSRFPVVNLDGLVNSYDYFHARKRGTETEFYQRYGITHFANLRGVGHQEDAILYKGPSFFHPVNGEIQFRIWPVGATEVVDPVAWFWERMELHFDYQSDGVGLLVDGRLAQAFAPDCRPEEFILWEWSGAGAATDRQAWTQTQTGLCVAVTVLPHDAAPPVQGKAMTASDYLEDLVGDHQPALSADFDVYLVENRLIYAKEPCAPADLDPRFFAHLEPVELKDLPEPRQQHGFDSLDFNFDQYGNRFGDFCLVALPLPEYAITSIYVGQYVLVEGGFEHIWEGEIRLRESR